MEEIGKEEKKVLGKMVVGWVVVRFWWFGGGKWIWVDESGGKVKGREINGGNW